MFPEAKLGIGPPITDGFYYDFDVAERVHPGGSGGAGEAHAPDRQGRPAVLPAGLRVERPSARRTRQRAVQARARRRQVRRPRGDGGRRRRAHRLRQPQSPYPRTHLGRPVPRSAHSDDEVHSGVQADPQLGRVLARRPGQRQPAAHLRHGVGVAGGARPSTSSSSRRRSGATTAGSAPSWTCSASPTKSVPGLAVFHPKGGIIRRELEDYSRRKHSEAGYEFVNSPHITKARAVQDLGPPRLVRRRHVPADAPRRRVQRGRHGAQAGSGLLPQADELPDALPDLPVARAVLSRTSVAALRVRHRLPLRALRCGARPDPGARADDGRRAHLLHPRTDARRADIAAAIRARPARPTTASTDFYLELSTKDPDKFVGSDEMWDEATETCCAEVGAASGLDLVPDPGGAAFYGPKISVQVKDALGRSWQMSTIQLDFNFPERFELEYTAADGTQAAAGDDPPRAVRFDRAVLRHPHRALRGRVPGVAGAGAGGRHSRSPTGTSTYLESVAAAAEVTRHPGRGRHQRRPDGEEDRQPHQPEGAVHAAGRRPRRRGRRGELPVR